MTIRQALETFGINWHWQNLNEKRGDKLGPGWRHGRAWFKRRGNLQLRVEWVHGKADLRCMLSVDPQENELQLGIAIPGLTYYVAIGGLPRALFDALPMNVHREQRKYADERRCGFYVHDASLWIMLWVDEMESNSRDPWWMKTHRFGLDDIASKIFGKVRYATEVIESRDVEIPMPEGVHAATVNIERATWTRPRWPWRPFSRERIRADVTIPKGIGFPGKGENSYDCGDDAMYGMTMPASTVEEAIGKVVAGALRNRIRYGGSHTFKATDVA